MEFSGWPRDAIVFYEELEADNSRDFWLANRKRYERVVRAPMELLLAELEARGCGSSKIFRPNRDVRFSHDKSPYKTNIAATTETGPYLSLSADGLDLGRGYYMMSKDQLERYRAAVATESTGRELERVSAEVTASGIEVTARESLRTAPRGYAKDHPRIELLRHKGLIAWSHTGPGAWLHDGGEVLERVMAFTAASGPLVDWLDRHVGPGHIEGLPK